MAVWSTLKKNQYRAVSVETNQEKLQYLYTFKKSIAQYIQHCTPIEQNIQNNHTVNIVDVQYLYIMYTLLHTMYVNPHKVNIVEYKICTFLYTYICKASTLKNSIFVHISLRSAPLVFNICMSIYVRTTLQNTTIQKRNNCTPKSVTTLQNTLFVHRYLCRQHCRIVHRYK